MRTVTYKKADVRTARKSSNALRQAITSGGHTYPPTWQKHLSPAEESVWILSFVPPKKPKQGCNSSTAAATITATLAGLLFILMLESWVGRCNDVIPW